ncbi:Hypothetical Protein RradSPS_0536 [Rubrobacter radiotolerans]|uniref:Uncharacterized protein n=1 Tax=Rubrobacter radiotolerans TaxID=42256 RepID=A0A023X172_RUBRA|nr:hypothetical protein [Rubrobacter radiotolerans]AHY45819.1 Hypothetical Protein RradSPS_0536 [Rubrobacter radiotolerans]MDX5893233.1 hypothetical protein [Rubrobacter radiotolerans]
MKTLFNLIFVVVVGYILLTSGLSGLVEVTSSLFGAFSDALSPHVTEVILDAAEQ